MKRSVVIALAGLMGGGVLTAAACFPDVMFAGGSGGSGGAGSGTQASSGTGTSGSTGSSSASSSAGSASSSASSSSTSSGTNDGGCPSGNPCDCDDDHDNANTFECNFDGGDCNDHDPDVNSKQTKYFDVPGSNGWDYNCNKTEDLQYTQLVNCLTACSPNNQWTGLSVPGCGAMAAYAVCVSAAACMQVNQTGKLTQGCH